MKKKMKNKLIFLIIIGIICLFTLYTFSKFVLHKEEDKHIQNASKFYFESNILEDEKMCSLYNFDGKDKYTLNLELKNYIDKLRITGKDISYEVTAKVVASENADISIAPTENIGILNGSEKVPDGSKNAIQLVITGVDKLNSEQYVDIEVIAKAISPYEKTLKRIFRIYGQDVKQEINLENISEEYSNLYIINTKENQRNFTIKYNNKKVILDTNDYILSATVIKDGDWNSISVTLQKGENCKIRLIKKDSSVGDLQLGEGNDIEVKESFE